MPVQAFGEQPEARRQVVTSPVGIADRRLLLILGTLTIGLLAASEMTRPWRQDGISVGDAAMFLLLFSLYAWIAFGFLNALAGFLGLAANCLRSEEHTSELQSLMRISY